MNATAHPQPSGDPAMVRAAAVLEGVYRDWSITVSRGRFVARHRYEDYNAHREQWGMIKTTVFADTHQQMRYRLDTQQKLRTAEAPPVTEVYQYMGGGQGEIVPPGTVAIDYAHTWRIRCFRWCGDEWWMAHRHTPAPDGAHAYGVRNEFAPAPGRTPGTWSTENRVRQWLEDQAEAWHQWETGQYTD